MLRWHVANEEDMSQTAFAFVGARILIKGTLQIEALEQ